MVSWLVLCQTHWEHLITPPGLNTKDEAWFYLDAKILIFTSLITAICSKSHHKKYLNLWELGYLGNRWDGWSCAVFMGCSFVTIPCPRGSRSSAGRFAGKNPVDFKKRLAQMHPKSRYCVLLLSFRHIHHQLSAHKSTKLFGVSVHVQHVISLPR